ncbi:glutamate dehydrogenase (NAD(+)) NDAI_0H03750 [Naumovozyma dairenensis CBS 421]|uniref:NAD-specific glutamate dehydrogenase n=1 Tax=Naumovozyma dairenensis (strain ATCC 10597 / BCRC 20456 / CBS 421 / NBRC 0211 / NRRL Y-12639) TaxID=1071378 RepID=G0WFI7_NAUDC|nr:hypothetical protein NDAI_0H03750 [Naumovozyma dairenensis CBS 421]CCD26548.1 hypothetical protein NDAI_0H03750 [Naumovozyma dairenensis CBS 421]
MTITHNISPTTPNVDNNTLNLPAKSSIPPDISTLSISSLSDYHVFDFPGKESQREEVVDILDQQGFIPDNLIEQEVDWFYNSLGIDDLFFSREKPQIISNIIHSLYASKIDSFAKSNFINNKPQYFNIKNKIITGPNHAIFMESKGHSRNTQKDTNSMNVDNSKVSYIDNDDEDQPYQLDQEIDDLFLDNKLKHSCRLVSFWTQESDLKLTFVYDSNFIQRNTISQPPDFNQISNNNTNKDDMEKEKEIEQNENNFFKHLSPLSTNDLLKGNIDTISDKTMAQVSSLENKKLYGHLINLVQERDGPVIRTIHSIENNDEIRLLVAFKRFSTQKYYSALNSLFHYYKIKPSKFYLETFKSPNMKNINNENITIFSIYLNQSQQPEDVLPHDLELAIKQIEREASLLYTIPNNSFNKVYQQRLFSPQEAIYAHVSAIFINHFINRLGSEYQTLISQISVRENDTVLLEVITNLKKKLRNETFTQEMIIDVLHKYSKIVSKLYKNFAQLHYLQDENKKLEKTLSFKRLASIEPFANDQEFETYLNKFIPNDSPDLLILQTLNLFNKSIVKTNFFITRKVAISFRLNPSLIMPKIEYPETPFGVFFVVGNTFKGFHIRFREISRGGIRIVCSKTQDIFDMNSKTVIDENYQLASTQQRKNKDIPEGGSKGVILLNPGLFEPDQTFNAFSQYVDAIIDILIKDPLKEKYIDYLDHEEILFFGPDEGTAGFVNWATNHAHKRGCPWWKSFLTGKSPNLGGIPHDEYGMTSLGVRAFVNKMYETLNLNDSVIHKFQTGGPDGDLGSNEILLSTDNEIYVGIVDGSGVICDPMGLDKNELFKLAHKRLMVSHYDNTKFSKSGFYVSVTDMDLMLPNGTIVANGTTFRNTFHTQIFRFVDHVDLFVPCGGRPNSISLSNLHFFIDEKTGKSKIPYIVEGANLFIAQAAKIELEKHGCILFKDASANKGGVTSSSLEVLASLALSDNDFVNKFIGKKNNTLQARSIPRTDGSLDEIIESNEIDNDSIQEDDDNEERTALYKSYVVEVQARIQKNAEAEFNQLWKINQSTGTPISELSNILSLTINKLNDDLVGSEELWLNDLKLRNYLLLNKIIPNLLIDVAGAEQVLNNIPEPYLKVMLSSYLSSTFVYQNGIDVNIGKFLEFIGELKREVAEKS